MGNKIGRNAPCPCGSGKKHKRCCGRPKPYQPPGTSAAGSDEPSLSLQDLVDMFSFTDGDDLDELSNQVVDHVHNGDIAAAEAVWEKLNEKYPDEIDPLDRKAIILEAKGEFRRAAEYYRKTAEYARAHKDDGFEEEGIEHFMAKARELEARADG
jgi:tetratricopeptide (TPR) repeat protein